MNEEAGKPLTPSQLEALRTYAEAGDQRVAAASLGISISTLRAHMHQAYRRLDVNGSIEAFHVLGWLTVPED